jgi:hypothetical protein
MKKTDVTCSECGAGFVRVEIDATANAPQGAYHCSACGHLLEQFLDGKIVAYRMTVRPTIIGVKSRDPSVNFASPPPRRIK